MTPSMTRPCLPATIPRRAVLVGVSSVASASFAGCVGSGQPSPPPSERSSSGGSTTEPELLGSHSAAADLGTQPTLGPDPSNAAAVIIAFEDPSCSRCRVFERETFPRIEQELVDTGIASFVFRGYPVVYPWGKPATQALESTYVRDVDAFWTLKHHYFDEQPSFSTDNVIERTREFLSAHTELDADAVVADVEARTYDAAVQADLSAGMSAGASRTTPTVFLFTDGEYRTKAAGSVSYSVVKNALNV